MFSPPVRSRRIATEPSALCLVELSGWPPSREFSQNDLQRGFHATSWSRKVPLKELLAWRVSPCGFSSNSKFSKNQLKSRRHRFPSHSKKIRESIRLITDSVNSVQGIWVAASNSTRSFFSQCMMCCRLLQSSNRDFFHIICWLFNSAVFMCCHSRLLPSVNRISITLTSSWLHCAKKRIQKPGPCTAACSARHFDNATILSFLRDPVRCRIHTCVSSLQWSSWASKVSRMECMA